MQPWQLNSGLGRDCEAHYGGGRRGWLGIGGLEPAWLIRESQWRNKHHFIPLPQFATSSCCSAAQVQVKLKSGYYTINEESLLDRAIGGRRFGVEADRVQAASKPRQWPAIR